MRGVLSIESGRARYNCYVSLFFVVISIVFGVDGFVYAGSSSRLEEATINAQRPNDVHVAANGIAVPIGRLLLIRRREAKGIGIIRFNNITKAICNRFNSANYDSYYSSENDNGYIHNSRKATFNFIAKHMWWGNQEVSCGPIRLRWLGGSLVYFYDKDRSAEGDYGIELAPTPWTELSQVNLSDSNIKWYKYQGDRPRVNIPIDNLWGNSSYAK